ncbi:MAG: type I restriction enzyme HsdR N-terminal domain-containing protein [Rhodospirillales bacterium]|nr:type I restriction enzyme HsdR N-terminal domain-containing protein [Rhodospirillales bacterium]
MADEAFARVRIDRLLQDAAWDLTDGRSVRFEYPLYDGGRADYVLCDRQGRALAVLETKSTSVDLIASEAQGRRYADRLGAPFIFLSNGEEVWFHDRAHDAHFRRVRTVFTQDALIRRKAAREIRRDPLEIPIDTRIAGGGGLDWRDVKPLIAEALADLDCGVAVYEPSATYWNVVKRDGVETLTPARAMMADMIRRYEILGFDCSIREAQKLAWFLAGAMRRLGLPNPIAEDFAPNRYGP